MIRAAVMLTASALLLLGGCASMPPPADGDGGEITSYGSDYRKAAETNADLGLRYMLQGRNDLALEKLKRALSYDSRSLTANHYIAELYRRLGKPEEAEQHFRRALDADKSDDPNPSLHQNYGVFLCTQKKYEEAEKQFQKVLENPVYTARAQVLENLGLCFKDKPDIEKAEGYLRQALQMSPRSPKSLLAMADVSLSQQNFISARAFLLRYAEVAPPTAESAWIGVRVERALGDRNAEASYGMLLRNRFSDSPQAREYLKSGNP